jgi:hypothetical protein
MYLVLWVGHLSTKLEPRRVETIWIGCGAWRIGRWSDGVSSFHRITWWSQLTDSPPVADIVRWEEGKVGQPNWWVAPNSGGRFRPNSLTRSAIK